MSDQQIQDWLRQNADSTSQASVAAWNALTRYHQKDINRSLNRQGKRVYPLGVKVKEANAPARTKPPGTRFQSNEELVAYLREKINKDPNQPNLRKWDKLSYGQQEQIAAHYQKIKASFVSL
jgi:hypothetical protein